jgi:DNA-binding transcriptional ArsR family regulator
LADQTRREIMRLVWAQERPAGEIAAQFASSRQAVSQHLNVLLDCGLVSVRVNGTRRLYRTKREMHGGTAHVLGWVGADPTVV